MKADTVSLPLLGGSFDALGGNDYLSYTGGFVTAVYVLDDAWFGNRTNGGDFRITDHGDGPETIRRIVVTPDVGQVAATTTTVPGSGDPPGIIFHNGPILTMADPPFTGALAVSG